MMCDVNEITSFFIRRVDTYTFKSNSSLSNLTAISKPNTLQSMERLYNNNNKLNKDSSHSSTTSASASSSASYKKCSSKPRQIPRRRSSQISFEDLRGKNQLQSNQVQYLKKKTFSLLPFSFFSSFPFSAIK